MLHDSAGVLNSFYDARQSKTARRFFQKQKQLQSQQQHNASFHTRNQLHPARMNNAGVAGDAAAEVLLLGSVSSSSNLNKVSNVNIHVEPYDWRSEGKIAKQFNDSRPTPVTTPAAAAVHRSESQLSNPVAAVAAEAAAAAAVVQTPHRTRRRRNHQRGAGAGVKSSKWSQQVAGVTPEKPVYVFVDYDYCDRALRQVGTNDEALRTLTAVKVKVKEDSAGVHADSSSPSAARVAGEPDSNDKLERADDFCKKETSV